MEQSLPSTCALLLWLKCEQKLNCFLIYLFIYLFQSAEEVPMSKVLKPHMLTLRRAGNLFRGVSYHHTSAAGVDSSTSPWPQKENSGQAGKKLITDSDNLQTFLNISRRDFGEKKVTATCFLPFFGTRGGTLVLFLFLCYCSVLSSQFHERVPGLHLLLGMTSIGI